MRLVRVNLAEFLTYSGTEVEFPPEGVTAIVGPNGAGKTALGLEAAAWALWGKTSRGTVPDGDVILQFEARGERWSVGRQRKSRRAGTLVLRRNPSGAPDDGGDDMTGQTATETQAKIESLVGSWDRFTAERVFSNRLRERFGSATDKERKALVEAILGLERHERASVVAREELGRRRNALDALRGKLATAQAILFRAEEAARAALAGAEGGLGAAEARAAEARATVERLRVHVEEGRKAERDLLARAGAVQRAYDQVVAQGRAEARDQEAAAGAARRAREAAERGLPVDACPTCLAPVTRETQGRLAAHHEAEAARLEAEAARLEKAVQASREEALDLRRDLEAIQAQAREAGRVRADREAESQGWARMQVEAEAALAAARERDARLRAAQEDLERAHQEHGEAASAEEEAELRCLEAEAAVKVLGPRGARVRRMDGALARLSEVATRILSRVPVEGVGPLRVEVRGSRVQASGKEVDELSVRVVGAGGGEYQGTSDGERARVDVALMLGFAALTAASGDGAIFFDELLDPLDDAALEAVVEIVEELGERRQVVLTTHNPRLLALLPGSAVWRCQRDAGGVSRVEQG